MKIALVACSKTKFYAPVAAQEMYLGALFQAARSYAQREAAVWLILSARYGVLHPEQIIQPYDDTLTRWSREQRRAWTARVLHALPDALDRGASPAQRATELTWLLLAGRAYTEYLRPYLEGRIETPLAGLGIGQQLAWLQAQNRAAVTEEDN